MKKNFTILMLLAFCCLGLNAGTVTDVITGDKLLENQPSLTDYGYYHFNNIQCESGAVYDAICWVESNKAIKMIFNYYEYQGFVTKNSNGTLNKITFNYTDGSNEWSDIEVSVSKNAYVDASDLRDNYDNFIGTCKYDSQGTVCNIPSGYGYICFNASSGDVYLSSIEIEWTVEGATVAKPTFSIPSGDVERGTEVALACADEADIYYTLDGSTPTTESTLYTTPIKIEKPLTIKAIACNKDGVKSGVATATYTTTPYITKLTELDELSNNSKFEMGIDLVVVNDYQSNYYVYDGETYSLIYDFYSSYDKGDVIQSGWLGLTKISGVGRPYLAPQENLIVKSKGVELPEPEDVTYASDVNKNNVNQYIKLYDVKIWSDYMQSAIQGDDYYGDMPSGYFCLNSGKFSVCPPLADTYDITGFVDVNEDNWGYTYARFLPVRFEQNVEIGSACVATYCTKHNTDFTNSKVRAYIATGSNSEKSVVVLKQIEYAPAGTGLILMADEEGTYGVTCTTYAGSVGTNYMKAVMTADDTVVPSSNDGKTNYILARHNGEVAFYTIPTGSTYTLAVGKAYLSLPTSSNKAPMKIVFDDEEVTGIEAVNCEEVENGDAYNLQGIKVDSNYKGFIIQNGKKFYNR